MSRIVSYRDVFWQRMSSWYDKFREILRSRPLTQFRFFVVEKYSDKSWSGYINNGWWIKTGLESQSNMLSLRIHIDIHIHRNYKSCTFRWVPLLYSNPTIDWGLPFVLLLQLPSQRNLNNIIWQPIHDMLAIHRSIRCTRAHYGTAGNDF